MKSEMNCSNGNNNRPALGGSNGNNNRAALGGRAQPQAAGNDNRAALGGGEKQRAQPQAAGNNNAPSLRLVAGPCVIESADLLDVVAAQLVRLRADLLAEGHVAQIYFKASFDKANRTSLRSFRGPGLEKGLQMLADVKARHHLPILTDIHESWQAQPVSEVADVLQIPAFLCRQTDLLVAAARTGRIVNIKKAQFLSGLDMQYPVQKVLDTLTDTFGPDYARGHRPWLTERGNMYGYNNLVVDFRNLPLMHRFTDTVIMDCTHSVQRPGGAGGTTGGNREYVPAMALAAKAFGADGYFFEVHPDPDRALSDGPNMLPLNQLEPLVRQLLK